MGNRHQEGLGVIFQLRDMQCLMLFVTVSFVHGCARTCVCVSYVSLCICGSCVQFPAVVWFRSDGEILLRLLSFIRMSRL